MEIDMLSYRHNEGEHTRTIKEIRTMKKTNYSFMVSWGMNCYNGIWRRVYEQDGRYFVKYNGKIIDVTDKEYSFIKD